MNPVLGKNCFAVRGILFNKSSNSNWKVVWHQDRTIAVRERKDAAHFGPWSVKAGVPHDVPPAWVMAKMLAIRLHLDENHESNGPLCIVPGSHKVGYLSVQEIAAWTERTSVTCTVRRGGAILMLPMICPPGWSGTSGFNSVSATGLSRTIKCPQQLGSMVTRAAPCTCG